MTLTSIMPSLRRSLPDPLHTDSWPEQTHASATDVFISGISMLRLAELCDTPCVHTGSAVLPGTGGRPSPTGDAAVVVASVVEVQTSPDGHRIAFIDGCLDRVPAVWTEARLIGRASTARHEPTTVLAADCAQGVGQSASLPSDLRVGDLLVVPCAGMVVLRELHASVPESTVGIDPLRPRWLAGLR